MRKESDDILFRLRAKASYVTIDGVDMYSHPWGLAEDLIEEAANEIERLRRVNGELALKLVEVLEKLP